jgi:ABC-2 type transport system permease protein
MVELVFWPAVDLLVWGFLTLFLQQQTEGDFPKFITFLIGAMIFWDVLFRSQQGVAISFLEDVWTRNLLNIFVAPVRIREFLVATFIVGILKIAIIVAILTVIAAAFYNFQLWSLGFALAPFLANLLLMGWSIGMVTTALILRYGQAVEALAWAIPFLIQPISAVFYPVSVLPPALQVVAFGIPSTHVFEGMRAILAGNPLPANTLIYATVLNGIWITASAAFFAFMFASARKHGYLTKLGTQ